LTEAPGVSAETLRSISTPDLVPTRLGTLEFDDGAAGDDLAALEARSTATQAAALTDPAGLGAHRVVVLTKRMS